MLVNKHELINWKVIINSGDQIPANIGLGENVLEKPSRSLEDVFSVTIFVF